MLYSWSMEPLLPTDEAERIAAIDPLIERAQDLSTAAPVPPAPAHKVNGLFSRQHRLPADCVNLAKELISIRDQIEAAVIAKYREVSLTHAAVIESVLIHHKRQRLLERWLIRPKHVKPRPWESDDDNNTQAIPLKERIQLTKDEAQAADARAKAIASLGLGDSNAEGIPWATVFAGMAKAASVIDASKAKPSASEGE